jgi:hypothetical protein
VDAVLWPSIISETTYFSVITGVHIKMQLGIGALCEELCFATAVRWVPGCMSSYLLSTFMNIFFIKKG